MHRRSATAVAAYVASGAIAGVVSRTATAPLEQLRLLAQLSALALRPRGPSGAPDGPGAPGPRALFAGNSFAVAKVVPASMVRFAVQEVIRAALGSKLTTAQKLFVGAMGGAASTIVTHPLEVARTRALVAQCQDKSATSLSTSLARLFSRRKPPRRPAGVVESLRALYEDEGLGGMYRGVWVAVASVAPFHAVSFLALSAAHELAEWHLSGVLARSSLARALAPSVYAAVGSAAATTAVYPLDVVKKAVIVRRRGAVQAAREIVGRAGVGGLYAGIRMAYAQVVPSAAATWVAYEACKHAFRRMGVDC
eukprot:m51a1_g9104 putative mitochondrial carrier protein (309) ;mRNA; r:91485-93186